MINIVTMANTSAATVSIASIAPSITSTPITGDRGTKVRQHEPRTHTFILAQPAGLRDYVYSGCKGAELCAVKQKAVELGEKRQLSDTIQACQLSGADPNQAAEEGSQRIEGFLSGYTGAPLL